MPAVTARFAADGAAFEVLADDGAQVAGTALTWPAFTVPAGGAVERHGPGSGSDRRRGPVPFRIEINGDGAYGPEPGTPPGSGAVIPAAVRAAAQGPSVRQAFPVVPEVVGRKVVEAQAVLEGAGYRVSVEKARRGHRRHRHGPAPDRPGRAGSLITLVIPTRPAPPGARPAPARSAPGRRSPLRPRPPATPSRPRPGPGLGAAPLPTPTSPRPLPKLPQPRRRRPGPSGSPATSGPPPRHPTVTATTAPAGSGDSLAVAMIAAVVAASRRARA